MDLELLMRLYRGSLYEPGNYIIALFGKHLGFNYSYPLTEFQAQEILIKLDSEMPELWTITANKPLEDGWIKSVEELFLRYPEINLYTSLADRKY